MVPRRRRLRRFTRAAWAALVALGAIGVFGVTGAAATPPEPAVREPLFHFFLARIQEDSLGVWTGGDLTTAAEALGRPADARMDIFALGVLLYHLAAGAPPFRGEPLFPLIFPTIAGRAHPGGIGTQLSFWAYISSMTRCGFFSLRRS